MSTRLETPNRRVAFITGVGRQRGIGAGVARALALRGWDLALTYWAAYDRRMPWGRASDETANWVGELRKHGVRVTSIEADLAFPRSFGATWPHHSPRFVALRIGRFRNSRHLAGEL